MYVTNEECLDAIKALIEDANLNLGYIGDSEEALVPKYPAVLVTAGEKSRIVHATATFKLNLNVVIWVYHAKLTDTHSQRTRADAELCTEIEDVVHADPTLGQNVIFGFIDSVVPGVVATPKKAPIVGSRMTWTGVSEERWR